MTYLNQEEFSGPESSSSSYMMSFWKSSECQVNGTTFITLLRSVCKETSQSQPSAFARNFLDEKALSNWASCDTQDSELRWLETASINALSKVWSYCAFSPGRNRPTQIYRKSTLKEDANTDSRELLQKADQDLQKQNHSSDDITLAAWSGIIVKKWLLFTAILFVRGNSFPTACPVFTRLPMFLSDL